MGTAIFSGSRIPEAEQSKIFWDNAARLLSL